MKSISGHEDTKLECQARAIKKPFSGDKHVLTFFFSPFHGTEISQPFTSEQGGHKAGALHTSKAGAEPSSYCCGHPWQSTAPRWVFPSGEIVGRGLSEVTHKKIGDLPKKREEKSCFKHVFKPQPLLSLVTLTLG